MKTTAAAHNSGSSRTTSPAKTRPLASDSTNAGALVTCCQDRGGYQGILRDVRGLLIDLNYLARCDLLPEAYAVNHLGNLAAKSSNLPHRQHFGDFLSVLTLSRAARPRS